MRFPVLFCCALICTAIRAPSAIAQGNYDFTNLVDSNQLELGPVLRLNDDGKVLLYNGSQTAIFVSSTSGVEKVVDQAQFPGAISIAADFNDQGILALGVTGTGDATAIYRLTGNQTEKLVGSSDFISAGSVEINELGAVAFAGRRRTSPIENGVFRTNTGGGYDTLLLTGNSARASNIQIDDSGAVYFVDSPPGLGQGIYRNDAGGLTEVVHRGGGVHWDFADPLVNANGLIAFGGAIVDSGGNLVNGFVGHEGGQPLVFVDLAGPFDNISNRLALNDLGAIAFNARPAGGEFGVFAGPDPNLDVVLKPGDDLFGSKVTGGFVTRNGLNNLGQLAIQYTLENGVVGVALATPTRFHWRSASDGQFSFAKNWAPQLVPGDGKTAALSAEGQYSITISQDTVVGSVEVGEGTKVAEVGFSVGSQALTANQVVVNAASRLNLPEPQAGGAIQTNEVLVRAGGRLEGAALIRPKGGGPPALLQNEGTLRPGFGPGTPRTTFNLFGPGVPPVEAHVAVVTGDFAQGAGGSLIVELDANKRVGATATDTAADLFVTGKATLDGELQVKLADGFQPEHGDVFNVMLQGSLAKTPTGEFTRFSAESLPILDHNGLSLVTKYTDKGVRLVVPQKVVLAWGHDAPFSLKPLEVFGIPLFSAEPFGTTPAFNVPPAEQAALATFRNELVNHVRQQFTETGIDAIDVSIGAPEENAINVYFVPEGSAPNSPNLLGRAVSGIDRFNEDADGEVVVLVSGFDAAAPTNVELDAETVTHEVGHVIGLRHVDPPGDIEVMDYDSSDGDVEVFINTVSTIREPPQDGGVFQAHTHNPVYHVNRFIEGVPHTELVAQGINPGTWDSTETTISILGIEFSFFAPGLKLYDVSILETESAPDEVRTLAHFDEITVEELAAMTFEIDKGNGVGLLASSSLGGSLDIALLLGEPGDSEFLTFYPLAGDTRGFLQMESSVAAGFETLSEVTITARVIPEPTALLLAGLAAFLVACRKLSHCRRVVPAAA
jgi:hypothetical protein